MVGRGKQQAHVLLPGNEMVKINEGAAGTYGGRLNEAGIARLVSGRRRLPLEVHTLFRPLSKLYVISAAHSTELLTHTGRRHERVLSWPTKALIL